ncbi:MAG: DUF3307 domain-containing protein [Chloroflexi bacterium]|nr:DUF3307 domain-containing protein [Chloroflexota bacterium]
MNWHMLIALIIAHLLADFPLQTDYIYTLKVRGNWGIIPHVLVHVVVTAFLLATPLHYWPLLLGIFVSHYLIDWLKLHLPCPNPVRAFLLDQAMHLVTLTGFALWMPSVQVIIPPHILLLLFPYALIPALLVFHSIRKSSHQRGLSPANCRTLARLAGFPLLITLLFLRGG